MQAVSVFTCNALRSFRLRQLRLRRIWNRFEAFPRQVKSLAASQKPCKSSWQMPWKLSVGKDVQRNLGPTRLADFLSTSILLFLT